MEVQRITDYKPEDHARLLDDLLRPDTVFGIKFVSDTERLVFMRENAATLTPTDQRIFKMFATPCEPLVVPPSKRPLGSVVDTDRVALWRLENPSPLYKLGDMVMMSDGAVHPNDLPALDGECRVYRCSANDMGIRAMCAHIDDGMETVIVVTDIERQDEWTKHMPPNARMETDIALSSVLEDPTKGRVVVDRASLAYQGVPTYEGARHIWLMFCAGDVEMDGTEAMPKCTTCAYDYVPTIPFDKITEHECTAGEIESINVFRRECVGIDAAVFDTPQKTMDMWTKVNKGLILGGYVFGERVPAVKECCICLQGEDAEDVEDTRTAKIKSCGHSFHMSCIKEWNKKHGTTCPYCRERFSELSLTTGHATLKEVPLIMNDFVEYVESSVSQAVVVSYPDVIEALAKRLTPDSVQRTVTFGDDLCALFTKPLSPIPTKWNLFLLGPNWRSLLTRQTVLSFLKRERIRVEKTRMTYWCTGPFGVVSKGYVELSQQRELEEHERQRLVDEFVEETGLSVDELDRMREFLRVMTAQAARDE